MLTTPLAPSTTPCPPYFFVYTLSSFTQLDPLALFSNDSPLNERTGVKRERTWILHGRVERRRSLCVTRVCERASISGCHREPAPLPLAVICVLTEYRVEKGINRSGRYVKREPVREESRVRENESSRGIRSLDERCVLKDKSISEREREREKVSAGFSRANRIVQVLKEARRNFP